MKGQIRDLQIGIAPSPRGNTTDFLHEIEIPIQITNQASHTVAIKTIALRFQSNYRVASSEVTSVHNCHGFCIEPNHTDYQKVIVVPNLLFRPYTNLFNIKISYHRKLGRHLSKELTQEKPEASYVIANPAIPMFGDVFISYKDPEDLYLAEQFHKLAGYAGFSPYIAPKDIKPGTKIWGEKISQAIRNSKCMFVIWTSKTSAGTGVQREINICRKAGVPDILLLQKGLRRPRQYRKSTKEYVRFEPSKAILEFAKTLEVRRKAC